MASTSPAGSAPPSSVTDKKLSSKIYQSITTKVDRYVPNKFRPLWQHPAGPKTVFFWAPFFKWGLVIAGLSDLARPAESLSVQQCAALAATGIIWSRYSLVIIPKNYGLFSVNLFVGLTQCVQLARAYIHQSKQKSKKDEAKEQGC